MLRLTWRVAVFACLLSVGSPPRLARASWPLDGAAIPCGTPCDEANPFSASDGAGGVFVVWEDGRSRIAYDLYAHHLTGSGDLAAGWPHDGLPVCVHSTGKSIRIFSVGLTYVPSQSTPPSKRFGASSIARRTWYPPFDVPTAYVRFG